MGWEYWRNKSSFKKCALCSIFRSCIFLLNSGNYIGLFRYHIETVHRRRKKEISDCQRVRQRCYKIWPTCDYNTDRQDKCLKCQGNIYFKVIADTQLWYWQSWWHIVIAGVFWKYKRFLPKGYRILVDWHMIRNGYQHKPLSNC